MSCENESDLKNIKLKDGDKVLFHDLKWFEKNWVKNSYNNGLMYRSKDGTDCLYVREGPDSMSFVLGKWFFIKLKEGVEEGTFLLTINNHFYYSKSMICDVIRGEQNGV